MGRAEDHIGAAPQHLPDCDLKLVCSDGAVSANRCVLCRASSVLRATLGLALPVPGELSLPADSVESWRVALSLLSLEAYPLQLVALGNVKPLLLLADKYDIPVVRGACAHFLHLNSHRLSLAPPISSAANVLTAASLAVKYICPHPSLEPYGASVRAQLDLELAPLRRTPEAAAVPGRDATGLLLWQMDVMRLVGPLEDLVGSSEYMVDVAQEVQLVVSSSMFTALRNLAGRLPPLCGHCSGPLPAGTGSFHVDCANAHFVQQHTRPCRMCAVPMPPYHARFCNSCAYKRNKK